MSYDCACDYDPPIFYNASKPRARKAARCDECGAAIEPGHAYELVNAKWPESWGVDTFRTCERCFDLRTWVKNNLPCFCWAHGNMLNDAQDAVYEALWRAPAETVGLRFGFLRRAEGHIARTRMERRRAQTEPRP